MNSKDRVIAATRNQVTDRAPWVPFVGCHAAKLIGATAERFFQSADLIVRGVETAAELYRPDGLPALFDLQLEAEAMGCRLQWAPNNPPAVISHPLEDGLTLADLRIPGAGDGRFPIVLDAVRRICAGVGRDMAIYGLITGPFTLALHLLGTEIFYQMIDDPDAVHRLMDLTARVGIATARMYLEAGVDIIAVVDPMTSQISPASFAEFVTPYAARIFDDVHDQGKPGTFFVCGNARNNIEAMCQCHADGLSIDENIPLDEVRDICRRHGLSFGGNIRLTVTMLFGSPADNVNDAMNCLNIGGSQGFILAPGCDMPFDVPPENVTAISALVHGEITGDHETSNPLDGVEVTLPDYQDQRFVAIDVVTLDSASCAPCQYMMEAVKSAATTLGQAITYQEHKIKDKEGVVAMQKLGVCNLPTIVVDGQIRFISVIPDIATLVSVLREAMARKGLT
jgi:uroporphyrinogen decarboxylase